MTERFTRRRALVASGGALTSALAGCAGILTEDSGSPKPTLADFRGKNPLVGHRPKPPGTSIADLEPLDGPLSIYLGGDDGGRHEQLITLFEDVYPDFEADLHVGSPTDVASDLRTEIEEGNVRADVFWASNAGPVAALDEHLAELPKSVTSTVRRDFRPTNRWVGVNAFVRAIAYDSKRFDRTTLPTDIGAYARDSPEPVAWSPRTSFFRSFVTALRHARGTDGARSWLRDFLDRDPETTESDFFAANAVATGDASVALTNHYDVLRVRAGDPRTPLGLAYTDHDAGTLVDASTAGVLDRSPDRKLAGRFLRHLLSAEAQEFFATRSFTYPTVASVTAVDALPDLTTLSIPGISLAALGDVEETDSLLRDLGLRVSAPPKRS